MWVVLIIGVNFRDIEVYIKRVRLRGVKKNKIIIGFGYYMGSCKMGSDFWCFVVDGEGEIWEVEGFYVSDGSVLLSVIGVNFMVII